MQAVKKTDRQRSFLWKFYRYTTSLTEAGRQTDRQRDRKRDRQTKEFSLKILPLYKLPDRGSQTGSQTDRQTGRQAGRQTDRQIDRQTDRQTVFGISFSTQPPPFLFPCRCEGGTDAAQVELGTQESRIVPPERVKTKLSSHFESLSSFFEKYEKMKDKISQ